MQIMIESLDYLKDKREILQEQLNNYIQEKQKLEKMSSGKPAGISAIDTSRESIQMTSTIKYIDAIRLIDRCNKMISGLFAELNVVDEKIEKILKNAKQTNEIDEQIYYYRNIRGYTQEDTAELIGLHRVTIANKEKRLKSTLDARC